MFTLINTKQYYETIITLNITTNNSALVNTNITAIINKRSHKGTLCPYRLTNHHDFLMHLPSWDHITHALLAVFLLENAGDNTKCLDTSINVENFWSHHHMKSKLNLQILNTKIFVHHNCDDCYSLYYWITMSKLSQRTAEVHHNKQLQRNK